MMEACRYFSYMGPLQSTNLSFQYLSNKKQEITLLSHLDTYPAGGQHNEITVFVSKF